MIKPFNRDFLVGSAIMLAAFLMGSGLGFWLKKLVEVL